MSEHEQLVRQREVSDAGQLATLSNEMRNYTHQIRDISHLGFRLDSRIALVSQIQFRHSNKSLAFNNIPTLIGHSFFTRCHRLRGPALLGLCLIVKREI
jgi:hypothetical protein